MKRNRYPKIDSKITIISPDGSRRTAPAQAFVKVGDGREVSERKKKHRESLRDAREDRNLSWARSLYSADKDETNPTNPSHSLTVDEISRMTGIRISRIVREEA